MKYDIFFLNMFVDYKLVNKMMFIITLFKYIKNHTKISKFFYLLTIWTIYEIIQIIITMLFFNHLKDTDR